MTVSALGTFDAVVSNFAIHHTTDARKREIFAEVFALLRPGALLVGWRPEAQVPQ